MVNYRSNFTKAEGMDSIKQSEKNIDEVRAGSIGGLVESFQPDNALLHPYGGDILFCTHDGRGGDSRVNDNPVQALNQLTTVLKPCHIQMTRHRNTVPQGQTRNHEYYSLPQRILSQLTYKTCKEHARQSEKKNEMVDTLKKLLLGRTGYHHPFMG